MEGWDSIMDWVWARHHNEWSWHIRPLLILAFCAAAYFRSGAGVMICALLFPLSAILFPAPVAPPRPEVVAYLERERALLERAAAWQIAAFCGGCRRLPVAAGACLLEAQYLDRPSRRQSGRRRQGRRQPVALA